MKYIIANWKANKNISEALDWTQKLLQYVNEDEKLCKSLESNVLQIIIAPPAPLLYPIYKEIKHYKNIYLAAQDVSMYETGKHTGEITADTLKGLATYCIIGHSERRTLFHESNENLTEKVSHLKKAGIVPLLCARDSKDLIPNIGCIIYETPSAIGNGHNEQLQHVLDMKKQMNIKDALFLYGGSVSESNAQLYLNNPDIDGCIVGTDSLDINDFYKILSVFTK